MRKINKRITDEAVIIDLLMKKFQPEGGYGPYQEEKLALTRIVRIDIVDLSGKEELGKVELREKVLPFLKEKRGLPVVIV